MNRISAGAPMQHRENELVILLADISGYTRFMVENQRSAIHGQICVTTLIEALLREVDIPLTLQEIEGDAVFLYAEHPGETDQWIAVLELVRTKLHSFFHAFQEGMAAAVESTSCGCAICSHSDELSLKIVVHTGTAVFRSIVGRPQVSGADLLLARRLLNNSVDANQYLLMSDVAYQNLGAEMDLDFSPSMERYDDFEDVMTHVHVLDPSMEAARAGLYAKDEAALTKTAREYVVWAGIGQVPAAFAQLKNPTTEAGWLRRFVFALWVTAGVPLQLAFGFFAIPRKLLGVQRHESRKSPAV